MTEPAADLAVAAALISAARDAPLPPEAAVFGEISLSGAVRPAPQAETRIREALKLGFSVVFAPSQVKLPEKSGIKVERIDDLAGFISRTFGDSA